MTLRNLCDELVSASVLDILKKENGKLKAPISQLK